MIAPKRIAPASGQVISATGLTFVLEFMLPGKQVDLILHIREHKIPVRVQIKSAVPAGRRVTYVAKFSGIKADDWDSVVRYVQDLPEHEHVGSYFDPETPDDDYRLLPLKIQQRIVSELVARRRLVEPSAGAMPLIRMKKIGEQRQKDGFVLRKISIHSRIIIDGVHKDTDTLFTIDSNGNVEVL